MSEPLFFDCLTDTQIWSLFAAGVLHDYRLPTAVYERLERLAPEHDGYLFTWPVEMDLSALHELISSPGMAAAPSPEPDPSPDLRAPTTTEFMRAAIQALSAQAHNHRATPGERIYLMATFPAPSLRPGPYLELQVRDLDAMSLPELEAYLADVLRLDEAQLANGSLVES
jgi:hypothetical protein